MKAGLRPHVSDEEEAEEDVKPINLMIVLKIFIKK